ncbi:MAG: iron-containing alcohol dehydrogenase [Pigmentiphaga sp.]|nr:iron-containing alcohol dehydrogenase [Pigmentiphaga sp.]
MSSSFAFHFETAPQLWCEPGAALRVGARLRSQGIERAAVITDAGLVRLGVIAPLLASLREAGLETVVFDRVEADPPEALVEEAGAFVAAADSQAVIGIGGGSSLDTAKLVALLARTPQPLTSIYGIGLAKGPRLPLVQIPTTAGTGSEVTPTSVISTPDHQKKGVIASVLLPDLAVLDAALTLGLPPAQSAMTGIDAMVHAIEAYTTRSKKNPLSDVLARQALDSLDRGLPRVIGNPQDLEAREAMLFGSMLAGMAFANAPVAAVHALAHPLGTHFHIPHGLANALVLVPVLRFNLAEVAPLYAELGRSLDAGLLPVTDQQAAGAFIDRMAAHIGASPIPQGLSEVGIAREDLPLLAEEAMKVGRLLQNNRREVRYEDALALYTSAY